MTDVKIYITTSYFKETSHGEWRILYVYSDRSVKVSGSAKSDSESQIPLIAAIEALNEVSKFHSVFVYTDSGYLSCGMNKKVVGWSLRGWRRSTNTVHSNCFVENRELWEELFLLSKNYKIKWKHSGSVKKIIEVADNFCEK